MSFNCKRTDGEDQSISWQYIKKAWLPAVTCCLQNLYVKTRSSESVPNVEGFEIEANGIFLTFRWNDNENYSKVFGEIKINDGEWIDWAPSELDGDIDFQVEDEQASFTMPLTHYGFSFATDDTIYARMRFGNSDSNAFSATDATASSVITKYTLLSGGIVTPDLDEFLSNISLSSEDINFELSDNNILVDRPDYIIDINFNAINAAGVYYLGQCINLEEVYLYQASNTVGIDVYSLIPQNGVEFENILNDIYVQDCSAFETLYVRNLPEINWIGVYDCPNFINVSLTDVEGNGGKAFVGLYNNSLSAETINNLFESLGNAFDITKSYVDIGNNPGSDTANVGIAVEKGWTVLGGPNLLFISTDPTMIDDALVVQWQTGTHSTPDPVNVFAIGKYLYVDNMIFTSINLNDVDMTGYLRVYSGQLDSIEVTNNDLIGIDIWYGNYDVIDLAGNTNLKRLVLQYNSNATIANINIATQLEHLQVQYALPETIDITTYPSLTYFECYNSPVTTLDFSNSPLIQKIYANSLSALTSINLTDCENLTYIELGGSTITSLDVSDCLALETIWANDTNISDPITISGLSLLRYINFAGSNPSAIVLNNLPLVYSVECAWNDNITSLTLQDMPSLESVYSYQCPQLSSISMIDCDDVTTMNITNCAFTNTVIDGFLTSLIDRTSLSQGYIYLAGNPGSGTCTPQIGGDKNWFVGVS